MAMKNIAAFGICPDQGTVNDAIESLKAAGFRQTDISVHSPKTWARKISFTKNTPKRRKAQWPAVDPAQCSAQHLDGWLAQARCSFPAWSPCRLRVRSWECWAEWAPVWRWAASSALWSVPEYRNMRRNATKGGCARAAFFYRCIATTLNGRRRLDRS